MSEQIGWLGLGALGFPTAWNLQESGYQLVGHNRTQSKTQAIANV